MLTALFLALNPSSIGRTQLGFLRHEPLGILLMLLIFLFFRRSTVPTTSTRKTVAYSALAGFSLFYLAAEWAGSLFPLDLIPLYVVILVLIGRYSKKLFLSYSMSMGIFLLFTPFLVPKLGFGSLTDLTWLAVLAGELVLVAREASTYLESTKMRLYTLAAVVLGTGALVVVLSYFNIVCNTIRQILCGHRSFRSRRCPDNCERCRAPTCNLGELLLRIRCHNVPNPIRNSVRNPEG